MKKIFRSSMVAVMISSLFITAACTKSEKIVIDEEEVELPVPTVKSNTTTFKFAATGKDCGLTDGFADQQHNLPQLIHLNTDKCNGETFRPTITLNFGEAPVPGTYTVVNGTPAAKQVKIESIQYNFTDWNGTEGSVVVTPNKDDATKVDIELKSIKMANKKGASDPKNPATDVLTGFIIKI